MMGRKESRWRKRLQIGPFLVCEKISGGWILVKNLSAQSKGGEAEKCQEGDLYLLRNKPNFILPGKPLAVNFQQLYP